jgi:RHS repeat-associated protein
VIEDRYFIYDGWNVIEETIVPATGPVETAEAVWGTDLSGTAQGAGGVGGLLLRESSATGASYYHYDGNGNVTALTSGAGTVQAAYTYGPFGETLRAVGPLAQANPWRFSTKYQDDETGLLYYGYRFYNPTDGRWLSRDPIEEEGGLNLFSFLYNNAVVSIDYIGLFSYDPKTKILTVGKCEITLAIGHGSAKKEKLIKWKFQSPCAAGAALMCFSKQNSATIPDENRIPGALNNPHQTQVIKPPAAGAKPQMGDDALRKIRDNAAALADATDEYDAANEATFDKALLNTLNGAYEKAEAICKNGECSCPNVIIDSRLFPREGWGSDQTPKKPFEYTLHCNRVGNDDRARYKAHVDAYYQGWLREK